MKPAPLFAIPTPAPTEKPAPQLYGDFEDADLPAFVRWVVARARFDADAHIYLFSAVLKDRHFHRINGFLRHATRTFRWATHDATVDGKSTFTVKRLYARIVITLVHEGPQIFKCKVAVFPRT